MINKITIHYQKYKWYTDTVRHSGNTFLFLSTDVCAVHVLNKLFRVAIIFFAPFVFVSARVSWQFRFFVLLLLLWLPFCWIDWKLYFESIVFAAIKCEKLLYHVTGFSREAYNVERFVGKAISVRLLFDALSHVFCNVCVCMALFRACCM